MSDFKAKMHQIRFPLGLCPRPRWWSLQSSPNLLAVLKGTIFKGRERVERGGEYEGKERLRGKKGRGDVGGIWPTHKFWHGAPRLWPRAPHTKP